jgi:hypothetical protein
LRNWADLQQNSCNSARFKLPSTIMSLDSLGNWIPGPFQDVPFPPQMSSTGSSGLGSPEGIVSASPGGTYVDTGGGNFWVKQSGENTKTGWVEVVAGAGSTFAGAGSPEGVQAGAPGSTYLDTSTGNFWAKKTGSGSTGWIELVA